MSDEGWSDSLIASPKRCRGGADTRRRKRITEERGGRSRSERYAFETVRYKHN